MNGVCKIVAFRNCMCNFAFNFRQSSLKVCNGNLAEQLVVWLTSEGKSLQVFKKI